MSPAPISDPSSNMTDEDYGEPADVFVSRRPGNKRSALGYHRFPTAAEAINFAVETLPSVRSDGVVMVVGNKRFDLNALRALHGDAQRHAALSPETGE